MSYVLIVESPYYKSISDELLLGAKKELEEKKVQYKHVFVWLYCTHTQNDVKTRKHNHVLKTCSTYQPSIC